MYIHPCPWWYGLKLENIGKKTPNTQHRKYCDTKIVQKEEWLTEEHSGSELSKRIAHNFQETKINKKLKRANIYIRKFLKGAPTENKVKWNIERELKKILLLRVLICTFEIETVITIFNFTTWRWINSNGKREPKE